MVYIEPNTVMHVLKNCPLDTTYEHTLWFDDPDSQRDYFLGLRKYTFGQITYQRVNLGTLKVEKPAEDLYDCNYLMFQNSSFGNKWFYAFIQSVEYVNNKTTRINFVLDVMQTWHFDYELGDSFIEREHSETDIIGENTLDEGVAYGEYVGDVKELDDGSEPTAWSGRFVIATSFDDDGDNYRGGYVSGSWSQLYYHVFETASDAANFIATLDVNKLEGIVSVFYVPYICTSPTGGLSPRGRDIDVTDTYDDIDGYTPKNNKLFVYPYNCYYVTNNMGTSKTYRYEYFENNTPSFILWGSIVNQPSVILIPMGYKGVNVGSDNTTCADDSIGLSSFPQLGWNVDTYRAWLAQTGLGSIGEIFNGDANPATRWAGVGKLASLGIGALNAIGSAFAGNIVGQPMQINYNAASRFNQSQRQSHANAVSALNFAGSTSSTVSSLLSDGIHAAVQAPTTHGQNTQTVLSGLQALALYGGRKTIRQEYAQIVDNYFTMYGYMTKRVKKPNRNVRPHWTYTKTVNCVAHGSVPCDDMATIEEIYNKGITFWKNGNEIGNYSLDNSPT